MKQKNIIKLDIESLKKLVFVKYSNYFIALFSGLFYILFGLTAILFIINKIPEFRDVHSLNIGFALYIFLIIWISLLFKNNKYIKLVLNNIYKINNISIKNNINWLIYLLMGPFSVIKINKIIKIIEKETNIKISFLNFQNIVYSQNLKLKNDTFGKFVFDWIIVFIFSVLPIIIVVTLSQLLVFENFESFKTAGIKEKILLPLFWILLFLPMVVLPFFINFISKYFIFIENKILQKIFLYGILIPFLPLVIILLEIIKSYKRGFNHA
ncbi:hypothetical protein [Mycoplasmopsis cricetuli]|uniref:hypothetical protein n=1 Tax=Mycoplasmopsis cricetuli TaxID=171283 RepID=UPI00046F28DD|nr:hypothetical protein [Mycoplasmopsis cricetuli]